MPRHVPHLVFLLTVIPTAAQAQVADELGDPAITDPAPVVAPSDAVPAPPPGYRWHTRRADPYAVAPQANDAERPPVYTSEPLVDEGEKPSRLARIGVEIAGGYAGMFLGGLTGYGLGCAMDDLCLVGPIFGTIVGVGFGTPLGVWSAGKIMGGDGGFWATMLGTLAGWGLAALILSEVQSSGRSRDGTGEGAGGEVLALLSALPVAGGVFAFEITSD